MKLGGIEGQENRVGKGGKGRDNGKGWSYKNTKGGVLDGVCGKE
jgi:hypothetical protein